MIMRSVHVADQQHLILFLLFFTQVIFKTWWRFKLFSAVLIFNMAVSFFLFLFFSHSFFYFVYFCWFRSLILFRGGHFCMVDALELDVNGWNVSLEGDSCVSGPMKMNRLFSFCRYIRIRNAKIFSKCLCNLKQSQFDVFFGFSDLKLVGFAQPLGNLKNMLNVRSCLNMIYLIYEIHG